MAKAVETTETFTARVTRFIKAIPKGQVVGYGEIAALCGRPGAARAVAGVLRGQDGSLPWWRVVRSSRTLAPEVEVEQARLLAKEGWRLDVRGKLERKV